MGWDPLAPALPPGTRTVYLCPDGDLARLPWGALPGRQPGTVLLEDTVLAVVPSGKWLLGQLLYPQKADANDALVTAGAIDYGRPPEGQKTPYPALTETGRELGRVLEAFSAADGLRGSAATSAELQKRLPQARYAHLATHGYFDADAVTADQQRLRQQLEALHLRECRTERLGLRQHPLGYVGLALAGANDPKNDGVLTGLGIVDLPLEQLRLCVLSACETGLGELTAGEGVVGLQRAFHVAGCPNVIGSLWKVNDAATAALMAQFYHELRVNKRSPLEALREAQLTIYRHPERIEALAGERGRPALEAAAKLGSASTAKPNEKPKTTPTKLWAAFVLSGVGRDRQP
jgi:CHAT domain-containing protein